MGYDPEKHNSRSIRLKGYVYSHPGFYYVTICTQDHVERYGHVILDQYQIMPNHMHGILQIISQENGGNKSFGNGTEGTGQGGCLKILIYGKIVIPDPDPGSTKTMR